MFLRCTITSVLWQRVLVRLSGDDNNMIELVTAAKKAGAPIDAIGAQAHGLGTASASATQMYIDKLVSSTGVPVFISEFDLNVADDSQQKTRCRASSRCSETTPT